MHVRPPRPISKVFFKKKRRTWPCRRGTTFHPSRHSRLPSHNPACLRLRRPGHRRIACARGACAGNSGSPHASRHHIWYPSAGTTGPGWQAQQLRGPVICPPELDASLTERPSEPYLWGQDSLRVSYSTQISMRCRASRCAPLRVQSVVCLRPDCSRAGDVQCSCSALQCSAAECRARLCLSASTGSAGMVTNHLARLSHAHAHVSSC